MSPVPDEPVPVEVGSVAPDFELYTHDSERWRLSEHRGQPVVLLFFPGAFTSVCTTELNRVNNSLDQFGETEVVGISTDSPFVLEEFRSVEGFDFPLLSDHEAKVSEMYDAKYDANFTPMNLDRISKRAAFVVDGEGVLRYREVLENAGNQPDFDQILSLLEDLGGTE
jgi:peroxiredoxin